MVMSLISIIRDSIRPSAWADDDWRPRLNLTFTFESWGIAVWPFTAGRRISNTPYAFFVMTWASRFQSSIRSAEIRWISDFPPLKCQEENALKCPTKAAVSAAGAHSLYVMSLFGRTWKPYSRYPFEKWSNPFSCSLMVWIQFEYLSCLRIVPYESQ